MCVTEKETRQKQNSGSSSLCLHTPTHGDTLLGTVKCQEPECLHIPTSLGKMQCFTVISFVRMQLCRWERDGVSPSIGKKREIKKNSSQQPCSLLLSSPAQIWVLNSGMEVQLFWLSSPIFPSLLFSPRGSYCGIMDIPFLCLFSLEIFTHTKETKWNASLLSQPTLFAPVPLYVFSLLGWVLFFTPIPQRAHGNQNHQCCISQAFLLVVNYDNGIHTQTHTGFSSLAWPQNSIVLHQKQHNFPEGQLICIR